MRTARALVLILFAAAGDPAGADAAAASSASARVSGAVSERFGPEIDSFALDSGSVGQPDLSGSAQDPEGTARSDADVTFQTTAIVGGERFTAQGSASARSGLPVRESESTSHAEASFVLTEPGTYNASGTLSRSNAAGQCCAGVSVRLVNDDGDELFEVVVGSSAPPANVQNSGPLPPGRYTLSVEASVGFGFGAAASDTSGSASFDVALTIGLPAADTDGDALPDDWETDGVDVDGNGSIDLDLPGMGADPRHKDVFVELDYMPPHRFALGASALIADAFGDAPVANPDGKPGITLHLDNGADSVMNPATGAQWGSRSRQNALVHQAVLGAVVGGDYDWGAFDALRAASFDAARRTVFHYAISAHGHDGRVSGVARAIPGGDLLVTLGAGCAALSGTDCTLDSMAQAGTLMHELGHTLGLRHGGSDDTPYKPNYLSVMNYAFQLTGLQTAAGERFLDYSRFAIPLDERTLDESHGFGITSAPASDLLTAGFCPGAVRKAWPLKAGLLDFDCSGAAGGAVSSDVNNDGARAALPPFLDWPALVFDGGGSIGGAGATPPALTPRGEPELDELLAWRAPLDAALPAPGGPGPGPGSGPAGPGGGSPAALTSLRVRPGKFRARRGARIAYTLTAPARVRFTVDRLVAGHRRGGRCRATGRGPRCVRRARVNGGFADDGRAGLNTVRFGGRLRGRLLKPGRYRLNATPAGGAALRTTFRVRK